MQSTAVQGHKGPELMCDVAGMQSDCLNSPWSSSADSHGIFYVATWGPGPDSA